MSDIETRSKRLLVPFIQHSMTDRVITTEDQMLFSLWMTLRSFVFDTLVPSDEQKYYSRSQCLAFSAGDNPVAPPNTHIWIAPVKSTHQSVKFTESIYRVSEDDALLVQTFLMDQIAVQFATWKGSPRSINYGAIGRIGWNLVAKQIWPARRKPIIWSPTTYLDESGLETLRNRFRG